MIDNDLSKSIMSIAMDIEVSEFLIRQVVHEDIHYFSHKMRKSQFSSQDMKDKIKGFKKNKKTQASLLLNRLWFFSDEKISARIRR